MIRTIVVQTLTSSYDDGVVADFKEGSVSLTDGQTEFTITREAPASDDTWQFTFLVIENIDDANPIVLSMILTDKTNNAATYSLSPVPDSNNYVVRYRYSTV